ncbi:MAG: aldo/keto reductase [Chloroflexota bacterium]
MQTRLLGATGLEVSAVGWGGAGITLYGGVADDQVFATLDRARELGVNYWDTAPLYGRGKSEELIGRYLSSMGGGIAPVVATKVGYLPDGFDYSFDATMHCLEGSMRRLRLDHLPLVQIHDIEHSSLAFIMSRKGAYAALARMKAEGVVGHIGVSGGPPDLLLEAIETREFETVITHSRYTLLNTSAGERLIPRARELGIGVINGGPYATGILATGPIAGAHVQYREAPAEVLEHVQTMQEFFAANGLELREAALGLSLINPGITVTIPGARSPQELEDNVAVTEIDAADLKKILLAWREEEQQLQEAQRRAEEHDLGA